MIKAYYENSKGEILNLLSYPFLTAEADWFDAEWEDEAGGFIRTVQLDVFGKNEEDVSQNMEQLYRVLGADAETGKFGKLYVNDTFLLCRIKASKKVTWKSFTVIETELSFMAEKLSWVMVESRSFYPQTEVSALEGLDFPFNFLFDFTDARKGTAVWEIDHIGSNDFQMIVYGPCVNPRILINDQIIEVFATLEKEEYMIIDSRDYTVQKYLVNGTVQNLFHNRALGKSIFKQLPSGLLKINWSGKFGFDLTLFLERREAKW